MKKIITILLIMVISIFALTGCGETPIGFKAQYWHENIATTDYHPLTEVTEYEVKIANKTPNNATEVSNKNIKMEIASGRYVTTLKMQEDENKMPYYYFKTELYLQGKYVFNNQEIPFENDVVSETTFNTIVKDFMPISTKKQSSRTTTVIATADGYALYDFTYNYSIDYGSEDAKTRYELNTIGENKTTPIVKENTFSKYNKEEYIDNELLLLLPRAFDYDSGFITNFTTIDVVTQKVQNMAYNATSKNTNNPDIKSFNLKYKLNGSEVGSEDFKVAKVSAGINDTFSGANIEAYYANEHTTHRHRMVKCYTALNESLGYLEYTVKSVVQS